MYLQIAVLLSDNDITVRTVKELASGETRIDFDIDLKVDGYWIPYDECSGGQKTYVDMFFITRLFKMSGMVGMLILDETLRALHTDNLELVAKMISEAPINSTLLITHVDSFNHYDTKVQVSRVNGNSIYNVEGAQ